MILTLLKWILKATGKHWLVPYVKSIHWIGKPTGVGGSSALIDQALWVLLSGINNILAVHTNRNWVWPLWIEEQWQPNSKSFIPTGAGILGANLSRRNWTSLGHEHSASECMVDPVGMISVAAHAWSVLPYVKIDGELYAPPYLCEQARQTLSDGTLPVVSTHLPAGDSATWTSTVAVTCIDSQLRLTCRIEVKNCSHANLRVSMGFGARPYNVLSIGHINSIETIGSNIRINGEWDIQPFETPTRLLLGDRGTSDPMKSAPGRNEPHNLRSIRARSGISAASVELDVELEPQSCSSFGIVVTWPADRSHPAREKMSLKSLHAEPKDLIRSREEELRLEDLNAVRIRLPDDKITAQLEAVKLRLPAFDDLSHFSPGTFLYHTKWYRDSYFLTEAFTNLGLCKSVLAKIEKYPDAQKKNGAFVDHPGELDSHAIALCTMMTFASKVGDKRLQMYLFESVWVGLQWLNKQRVKPSQKQLVHEGLLPASFSAEHFGGCDHYFWDNFWSVHALKLAKRMANKLGLMTQEAEINKMLFDYTQCLQRVINVTLDKTQSKVLPVSPYRWPDAACVGNLVAADPLNLGELCSPWLVPTLNYVLDNHFHKGLFFQSIFHTGLNPYLTAQVARVLLRLEDPRALTLLESISRAASPTVTWPEAINPLTHGGCMGDGDHGWAAAEFCNLIRQFVVLEDARGVVLFSGIQPQWMTVGKTMSIDDAPTSFGRVSASVEFTGNGLKARWSLIPWQGEENAHVYISLPRFVTTLDCADGVVCSERRSRLLVAQSGERFFDFAKGAAV
ncbi:MAG: hypothetical protein RJB13_1265 [Pseudomonadota bacterium]